MPKYAPNDEEMDDAFYSPPPKGEGAAPAKNPPDSVDEEEAGNPTALVPVSALGKGVKVGDTVTVKVTAVHGDEAEVELSSGETKSMPPRGGMGNMMSADDELAAMDEG